MSGTPPPLRHHRGESAYTTPCSSLAADGMFRGIMVGIAWSAAFGPKMNLWALHNGAMGGGGNRYDAGASDQNTEWQRRRLQRKRAGALRGGAAITSQGYMPQLSGARTLAVKAWAAVPSPAQSLLRNCSAFGVFLGVFNGAQCSIERVRGKKDWKNAFFAGFASAAMFGLRNPNPLKMMSTCALTGAFCAAVGSVRDVNKKAHSEPHCQGDSR